MTLIEFYDAVGGNYDNVMKRLMTKKIACKYIFKFVDAPDYQELLSTVENGNWTDAFRFAHNLKGVGLNLGFDRMANAASVLCEEIRHGPPTHDVAPMLEKITEEYQFVLGQIAILQSSGEF